jgi:P-type Mg2+ transporter
LDLLNSSNSTEQLETVIAGLGTDCHKGLSEEEAKRRIQKYGKNLGSAPVAVSARLLLYQFKSPIVILFIIAAILSYFLENPNDAIIIFAIVFLSAGLGFWQERGATRIISKLLELVKIKSTVVRDGKEEKVPSEYIVPGDLLILRAGDKIPGDCRLIESNDLFVNEGLLTGESYPVEKSLDQELLEHDISKDANSLHMGSYVVSGMARAVVIRTGKETELGKISTSLKTAKLETNFEAGVRRFGYFLMEITLILVIANFAINIFLARSILDSFLFSLALAIGLTPQLLPAIISVNIAHGARRMASKHVIIKRLASIENLGSMNILCSDKTGTLTTGMMEVHSTLDVAGNKSELVLFYAYLNSANETGFVNPIDQAILRAGKSIGLDSSSSSYQKIDEIPYDFTRKRMSILLRLPSSSCNVQDNSTKNEARKQGFAHGTILISKGAVHNVLDICSKVQISPSQVSNLDSNFRGMMENTLKKLSDEGFRALGISFRLLDVSDLGTNSNSLRISKEDEQNSTFLGFLVLSDPIKRDVADSVRTLQQLGVELKIISGDNRHIAAHVGKQVGLSGSQILVGSELDNTSPEALIKRVEEVSIFAEIEPRQKERIILALKKAGNVVGYIGDGINDAPALHAADASISVDTAADVAKEGADMVLLEKDLGVLSEAIEEGRKTFANTLKYVFMATSANFGNMFSTAVASFFLAFLPMLPKQILLNNLLTDVSEMTIASDRVEQNMLRRPTGWNLGLIRKFMITFGILSACFDFTMFAVLILLLHASIEQFRSAWFIESVVSASLAILVIRSRRPMIASKPGRLLLVVSGIVIGMAALVVPLTPLGSIFGITSLPIEYYAWIALVVVAYIISLEFVKRSFFWHIDT